MVKKQSWEKRREKSMKIKENTQVGWVFLLNPHRLCKVIKCPFCWFKDSGERRRRSRQRRDLRVFARSPETRNGGTHQRSFTVTWMMEGAAFWGVMCVFLSPRGKRVCWEHPGESEENPAAEGGSQGGEGENGGCCRTNRHLSTGNPHYYSHHWRSDEDLCGKYINCLWLLSLSRNIAKCWSRGENSDKTAGG